MDDIVVERREVTSDQQSPVTGKSDGILSRIRRWLAADDSQPGRKLDYDFIVNELPDQYLHVDVVEKDGDTYLRSNICSTLYEPDEVNRLFSDLAEFDEYGSAEIDPFKSPPETESIPIG